MKKEEMKVLSRKIMEIFAFMSLGKTYKLIKESVELLISLPFCSCLIKRRMKK